MGNEEQNSITVICREVSKGTGEIAVYKVKDDADSNDLLCLRLKSKFNEELTYFAMTTVRANDEGIMDIVTSILKRPKLSQTAIDSVGGVVRL